MEVKHVQPKSKIVDHKDEQRKAHRKKLKGKTATQLTKAERDDLLIQMAKDLGYLE